MTLIQVLTTDIMCIIVVFYKAHIITETLHIFLEKSKNKIHKFVNALFLVFP